MLLVGWETVLVLKFGFNNIDGVGRLHLGDSLSSQILSAYTRSNCAKRQSVEATHDYSKLTHPSLSWISAFTSVFDFAVDGLSSESGYCIYIDLHDDWLDEGESGLH